MPSEQPREGTRVNPDGTEPPDELAARLDALRREQRDGNGNFLDGYAEGRHDAYEHAAQLARASTHPEQSARVSEDDLYVLTKFQRIMRSANRQHEVEAVDRILAALEPASPTPTEARVELALGTLRDYTRDVSERGVERCDAAIDVLTRALAALEPAASPAPTEQGEDQ